MNEATTERPVHPLTQGICGCPLYLDTNRIEHRDGCLFPAAAAEVHEWNHWFEFRHLPVLDAPVRYWTGAREGDGQLGTTRTGAQVLGGHTAVLWVHEHSACIALTHIQNLTTRYTDAHGEHWVVAGHDEYGQGWLRCEETNRGARNRESVELQFGPLTQVEA